MLMLTVDVLQRFPEARERWAKAFRYILVDEYQDTNHAQYVLLKLLAAEHQNLMASGTRTSRSTRSAAPTFATSSSSSATFPTTRVIPLEQNYRSTNSILARRERRHLAQPRAQGEEPLVRPRRGRARSRRRDGGRARRGTVRRGRDRGADRGRLQRRARSPSSTARTRRAACSRTCSCGRGSPTR